MASGSAVLRGPSLPASKTMLVHSADGTRLHTEVFGPADGHPIVLAHGFTCSLRFWQDQINDLSREFRVIAYDHRGHGRSGVPAAKDYSLDHLAADLDAVLSTTVRPDERAVIAGHSMGGVAISAWADRFRDRVEDRVGAVALINTTTGDLLDKMQLLQVPAPLRHARNIAARNVIRSLGGIPMFHGTHPGTRRFLQLMAIGTGADPAVSDFLHELLASTPPAGRGGWARVLADEIGHRGHIDLSGLSAPALVIGSAKDRLLPMSQTRKIADAVPNLIDLVEMPGGHCAPLEHPAEISRHLRDLVATANANARSVSA